MGTLQRLALVLTGTALFAQPPAAEKRPVTDNYQGVAVTDDYRRLENAADPAVKAWGDAQNLATRKYLDGLPARAAVFDELKKLYSQRPVRYRDLKYRRGLLFAMKTQPDKEQPALATLKSADDPASDLAIVGNGDGSGFYYTRYPRAGERPAPDSTFIGRSIFTG